MSTQITQNPYNNYGAAVVSGLTSVGSTIGTGATIATVVNAVVSFITSTYGFSSTSVTIQNELQAICYNAINMYMGNEVLGGQAGYNSGQLGFLQMLVGNTFTSNVPITALVNHVADIEDNIGTSQLGSNESMPLFLCTTTLTNVIPYWLQQVALGSSSSWHTYFPTSPENYIDVVYYAQAASIGSAAGFSVAQIDPSTNIFSNLAVAAVAGAITVSACKVVLGSTFMPRITNIVSLNPQTIANIGAMGRIGEELSASNCANCYIVTPVGCPPPVSIKGSCFNNCTASCVGSCNNNCSVTCNESCVVCPPPPSAGIGGHGPISWCCR